MRAGRWFSWVLSIALPVMTAAESAAASKLEANNSLPFSYQVLSIADEKVDATSFSVITLRLTNGPQYLDKVLFHCRAENAEGFSWLIKGQALNLTQDEVREFRIVSRGSSEDPKYTSNAESVVCRVSGFEASIF